MYKEKLPQTVPWDALWRPLTDFPAYWVSNYGHVFNMRRGELVRPYINNHGVKCVHIYNGSRGTSRSLRKLTEKHWGTTVEYQTQEEQHKPESAPSHLP